MNVNFLGLSMSKKSRLVLIIATILTAICLFLYVISGFFIPKEPEIVLIPDGQLSDSVFELQNMSYTSVDGLYRKYSFANMPFTVDVSDGELAKVDGADFLYNNPFYFYYNIMLPQDDISAALLSQVVNVIVPGYNGNDAQITLLREEKGNINGCSANYAIYCIKIPDVIETYACIYRLHVDDTIYKSEYDMIVGCISEGYTTENLANIQALSHSTVGTLRYDSERARELGKNK